VHKGEVVIVPNLSVFYTGSSLLIDLTFSELMDNTIMPDNAVWQCDSNLGLLPIFDQQWQSASILRVVVGPIGPSPAWVAFSLLNSSSGLAIADGTQVAAFGPITFP